MSIDNARALERFENAISKSGMSDRKICREASDNTFKVANSTITNLRDGKGISMYTAARVCLAVNASLDHIFSLTGIAAPSGRVERDANKLPPLSHSAPSQCQLIERHYMGAEYLEVFNPVLDYCDLFSEPDYKNQRIRVDHIGSKSLAGRMIGSGDLASKVQEDFDAAPMEYRKTVCDAHRRALESTQGFICDVDSIDQIARTSARRISVTFSRLAMRLLSPSGEKKILVFCREIGRPIDP